MNSANDWNGRRLDRQIAAWLEEDVGGGDVTTLSTISDTHMSTGVIHCKESGVIAGLPVAERVFRVADDRIRFTPKRADGAKVEAGDIIAELEGPTRGILTGERLALNLLQRLSGIATRTRQFVDQVQGLSVRIADTRKTTPGLRDLEKYAVRVGGGANHRFGLYDAVMIKDNHIKACGGIAPAVKRAKESIPHTMKIEVEVESLEQMEEALAAGADIIMFDNMPAERLREAAARARAAAPHVVLEASGGVTLDTVRKLAECGVDVISVGALTHSVRALDISLDLFAKKEGSP
jgi:nicotinate-nucleotide pyrophosphorylase